MSLATIVILADTIGGDISELFPPRRCDGQDSSEPRAPSGIVASTGARKPDSPEYNAIAKQIRAESDAYNALAKALAAPKPPN